MVTQRSLLQVNAYNLEGCATQGNASFQLASIFFPTSSASRHVLSVPRRHGYSEPFCHLTIELTNCLTSLPLLIINYLL